MPTVGVTRRSPRPAILVGCRGADSDWTALAWAVAEAAATDASLTVCRTCAPGTALAAAGTHPAPAPLELAEPTLARAVAAARARLGGERVTVTIRVGGPASCLPTEASEADLVVLGGGGGLAEIAEAVQRMPTTVIVVPLASSTEAAGPFAGHVITVLDTVSDDEELEFSFAYAARQRATLDAVVADPALSAGLHFEEGCPDGRAFTTGQLERLELTITAWAEKYPQVNLRCAEFGGDPATTLLPAARRARLLIAGAPQRGDARAQHFYTHLIANANCPTAFVRDRKHRGREGALK